MKQNAPSVKSCTFSWLPSSILPDSHDFHRLDDGNRQKNSSRCNECDLTVALQNRRKSTRVNSDLPPESAKIRKILELLAEIDQKEIPEGEMPLKTIIFSQFTSFRQYILIFS